MNKKWIGMMTVLVFAVAVYGGLSMYTNEQTSSLTLYGNVDIRTVDVSFRVSGRLASLAVDEGDMVHQGDVLGQIDSAPYKNSLNQLKATEDAAEAQLKLAHEGYRVEEIAQAKASVEQAKAAYEYAESFYKRQSGLWHRKLISANDLANATSQRNQARAILKSAKDKLDQYRSGSRPQEIMVAKANLALASAQRDQAELDLNDTTLVAPSDGIVLTRVVEPGTMLNSGTTVLTLSLVKPVWVRAYIDESDLNQAQPGTRVLVYHDGQPEKPYHGHIGYVSPNSEFTPKTVQTPNLRTDLVYRLRIIIDDADSQLRQGMPITITFVDGEQHAK